MAGRLRAAFGLQVKTNWKDGTRSYVTIDEAEDAFLAEHGDLMKQNNNYYVPNTEELGQMRQSNRWKTAWNRMWDFFTKSLIGRLIGIIVAASLVIMCYAAVRNFKTFSRREWFAFAALCGIIILAVLMIWAA